MIKLEKPTADDYRAIRRSIKKLASLLITSLYTNKDTENKSHIESNFRIFDKVVFKADSNNGKDSCYSNYVWLSDTYLKCISNGYMPQVNLDVYFSLEEGITRALYKLLLVNFQSAQNGLYRTSLSNLNEYLGFIGNNDKARFKLAKAAADLKKKCIIDDIEWDKGMVTFISVAKNSEPAVEKPIKAATRGR